MGTRICMELRSIGHHAYTRGLLQEWRGFCSKKKEWRGWPTKAAGRHTDDRCMALACACSIIRRSMCSACSSKFLMHACGATRFPFMHACMMCVTPSFCAIYSTKRDDRVCHIDLRSSSVPISWYPRVKETEASTSHHVTFLFIVFDGLLMVHSSQQIVHSS
jgi:hypothetical protein